VIIVPVIGTPDDHAGDENAGRPGVVNPLPTL
jgi:hypothetical protein